MYYDPRCEDPNRPNISGTALVFPRPIGWISTISRDGVVNLAPYSYFNIVSTNPPFVMFGSRLQKDTRRNAEETGEFVASVVTYDMRDQMNATSFDFAPSIGEPSFLGIEMAPSHQVKPPRVARSPFALECKYIKSAGLVTSDGRELPTSVVIGEVIGVYIDNSFVIGNQIDVARMKPMVALGYPTYSYVDKIVTLVRPASPEEARAMMDIQSAADFA